MKASREKLINPSRPTRLLLLLLLRRLGPINPLLHPLLMLSILQMHFKIIHRHRWAWGIQLPRTIQTPDPWEISKFKLLAGSLCGSGGLVGVVSGDGVGDGEAGFRIDGCVAHRAFEGVVGVGAFEACEAVY